MKFGEAVIYKMLLNKFEFREYQLTKSRTFLRAWMDFYR
jgi:hypothetical protein